MQATPTIDTQRLRLRPPGAADAEAVIAFYRSPRAALAGGNVTQPEAVTRFLALLGHWAYRGYGLFVVTPRGSDAAIGLVGPYYPPGRPETEIGWVLFDGHEGQGFATEAALATIGFARDTLGWTEIVHYIDGANTASIALAERIGAQRDPDAALPMRKSPGETLVYRQPAQVAA